MTPKTKNSLRVQEVAPSTATEGSALLRVLRIGICGTDRDIISGFYGEAPGGSDFLTLGHESISRIEKIASADGDFHVGDLVVPTVRRSCPENCLNCSSGESDMCITSHYKEHGIKQLHGFAAEHAITDLSYLVRVPESLEPVGVLLEPLTIVEKGSLQTFLLQTARMKWEPTRALVLGAGPVGLLGTAILRLRGLQVDTAATRSKDGLKPKLVRMTGATYINSKETPLSSLSGKYDIVFEVTGSPSVATVAQDLISLNGIVCYLGIYREAEQTQNVGKLFTDLVLGNKLHFGSVNANKTYFEKGVEDLQKIQSSWPDFLPSIITRREKFETAIGAYSPESEEEIKTVIEIGS